MSDETTKAAPTVKVELSPESAWMLSQLMPAVSEFAAANGMPPPSPADAVGLAIGYFHETVFARARAMIADGQVTPATRH